jgi:adenylyl cyclase-associated protein
VRKNILLSRSGHFTDDVRDKSHTEFIQAYYQIFKSLIAYIKEYFATGLTWNNANGIDAVEAYKQIQSGSATPKATASALGPPPPPPLPVFDKEGNLKDPTAMGTSSVPQGGDMTAVFDQLNQGSGVTANLRKVDQSQMTHKNPSLRAGNTVPQRTSSQNSVSSSSTRGKSPMPNKKPEGMRTKKPPRKELDGNKWIIENFDNTGSDVVDVAAELHQSILISRCSKCVIKVTGKANAISIDNCTGLSILVGSLVSSLDVIKSPKFQLQVDGVVPTIFLDQVDGATIYLSKDSLGTELFSSKSTSMNVVLPPQDEDEGDDKECALPEQIRSVIKNGALVSEVVEHAG